jgi:hypothetical protein
VTEGWERDHVALGDPFRAPLDGSLAGIGLADEQQTRHQ